MLVVVRGTAYLVHVTNRVPRCPLGREARHDLRMFLRNIERVGGGRHSLVTPRISIASTRGQTHCLPDSCLLLVGITEAARAQSAYRAMPAHNCSLETNKETTWKQTR